MPRIFVSSVIPAPVEKVWERIRDFNALPDWVPMVSESRIQEDMRSDQVGCIREFSLQNGDRITEQLVALSDYDMSVSYKMLVTPMALENYFATLRLTPVTETEETFVEWSAEFDCAAEDAKDLIETISVGVFETALKALARRLQS
ncbi:SRPBCC family protein [Rhodobacteraceae bacterium Araon29]